LDCANHRSGRKTHLNFPASKKLTVYQEKSHFRRDFSGTLCIGDRSQTMASVRMFE
jgi:hypothetical protein